MNRRLAIFLFLGGELVKAGTGLSEVKISTPVTPAYNYPERKDDLAAIRMAA